VAVVKEAPKFKSTIITMQKVMVCVLIFRVESHMMAEAPVNTIIRVNRTMEYSTSLNMSIIRKIDMPKMVIKLTSLRDVKFDARTNKL